MTRGEFKNLLNISQDKSNIIFKYFDMDEDRVIDEFEFICALAHMTKTEVNSRVEAIFSIFEDPDKKVCDKEGFEHLVYSLLGIQRGRTYTDEAINLKIERLMEKHFIKDNQVNFVEFSHMVWSDKDLKEALLNIGIFGREEVAAGTDVGDLDLTLELNRYKLAENKSEEAYQLAKKSAQATQDLDEGLLGFMDTKTKLLGLGTHLSGERERGVLQMPPDVSAASTNPDSPDLDIQLESVLGYRGHDMRMNLAYNPDGKFIYNIAHIAIQLDPKTNGQKHLVQGSEEIICIDTYNNLSATGEMGEFPILCLWDNRQMKVLSTFTGPLEKGIALVRFSWDGQLLAVSTCDEQNSIFVFRVKFLLSGDFQSRLGFPGALEATVQGPPERLLDLQFQRDNRSLVACSFSDVYFIEEGIQGLGLKKSLGWAHKGIRRVPCTSLGFLRVDVFVGTLCGLLLTFKGMQLFASTQAHEGPVYCIHTKPGDRGLLSGGSDGCVVDWDDQLCRVRVVELGKLLRLVKPAVNSICFQQKSGNLLVGTKGCDIIEIDPADKATVYMNGHFERELRALALVPDSDEVITCGEDSQIAKWDLKQKKLRASETIPFMASCCDISSDGLALAVGCDNGVVLVIAVATLQVRSKNKDRFKDITDLKFSPDCTMLAVAGRDNLILIYDVASMKQKACCKGHRAPVSNIDWAASSQYLQSSSSLEECMYWLADSGQELLNPNDCLRAEQWATWSAASGWPVRGVKPETSLGAEVTCIARAPDCSLLAAADNFGNVKLYRYPVLSEQANFMKLAAHPASIGAVRFLKKGTGLSLVSIGCFDRAIIEWKITVKHSEKKTFRQSSTADEFAVEKETNANTSILKKMKDLHDLGYSEEKIAQRISRLAERQQKLMGEKQFEKVARLSAPAAAARQNTKAKEPPEGSLYIKHVFGYRAFDAKDNARFLGSSNQVVYPSAGVAVVLDVKSGKQRLFTAQEEDVVSLDLSKDKKLVVTSSYAVNADQAKVDLIIWDPDSLEEKARIVGLHRGQVSIARFSPDDKWLLSIGFEENAYYLSVYDWANDRLVCQAKVDHNRVLDACWKDKNTFVTVGKSHIKFWSIKMGTAQSLNGVWGEEDAEPLLCCKYAGNNCFTGSAFGNIAGWSNLAKTKAVKAHDGPVFCLVYNFSKEKKQLISGGNLTVKVWELSKAGAIENPLVVFDHSKHDPNTKAEFLSIRSLDCHADGSLLMGFRNSTLIKITPALNVVELAQGHYQGKVSALACDPDSERFATAGGDNTLRLWNLITRKQEKKIDVESEIRALDWTRPDRATSLLAGGTRSGQLILFDSSLGRLACEQTLFDKNGWKISEVRFSTNGEMVAVGAQGPSSPIQIFRYKPGSLKAQSTINCGFTAGITRLDWAISDRHIVANSENFELAFVKVFDGSLVENPQDASQITWSSWTCTLGYPVQGIYPNIQGADVRAVCRSKSNQLLATGDDFHMINLFRCPSVLPKSGRKMYPGHSSIIYRARFCLGDNALVSCGGLDKTVIVWATDFGETHPKKEEFLSDMKLDENPIEEIQGVQRANKFDNAGNKLENNVVQNLFVQFPNSPIVFEEQVGGDESAQEVEWVKLVKPPSQFAKPDLSLLQKPPVCVALDHAHGYRVK